MGEEEGEKERKRMRRKKEGRCGSKKWEGKVVKKWGEQVMVEGGERSMRRGNGRVGEGVVIVFS